MGLDDGYLIVNARALPDVFSKVVAAKQLLASGQARNIQEAVALSGISRSVFYKYRDHVFACGPNDRGKTVTFGMNLQDAPGLLSNVLNLVAKNGANVLTIHQTIPINTVANVTITVTEPPDGMGRCFEEMSALGGLSGLKILNRE